jgi:hypothetical protein
LTAEGKSGRPQREGPYLRARALKRVAGVGGEAEPTAKILGNRPGLLALREQVDGALAADEGIASSGTDREADERIFDLFVQRAHRRKQMGEPKEPDRPDYSRMV